MNIRKLAKLIEDNRLSKVRLGEMTGISDVTISNILKGSDAKISSIEAIAKALRVPVGYFFDEEPTTGINNATIKGNNNVLAGRDNHIAAGKLNDCTKELAHLKALLSEKERTIQILMERK